MARLISFLLLAACCIAPVANAQNLPRDWDYYREEPRLGYRGAVEDERGRYVRDERGNCVLEHHLYNLSTEARLEQMRYEHECTGPGRRAPLGNIPQPPPPPEPEVDMQLEQSLNRLEALTREPPPPAVTAAPLVTIQPVRDSKIVFFEFGKDELTEVTRLRLDALVDTLLAASEVDSVKIVGHADRVGKAAKNVALSQRRANNVRDYLYERGRIRAEVVDVTALGESVSVTDCPKSLPKKQLVECLQPDRRVEIVIEGYVR